MTQVPFLDPLDTFAPRHIGPRGDDVAAMLKAVGAASLDQLIDEAIPASIRLDAPLNLPPPESESAYLARLKSIAAKNKVFRSFIGLGYSDTLTPSVIRRCVFENPGWYTPYTPYQAEIAQGRLESLLNFQTMVTDLTGMSVANASLLDEGTAAGEAMTLLHRVQGKKLGSATGTFLVSDRCFPQTIEVLKSRAEPLGIELRIGPADRMAFGADVFGALVQYPDEAGRLEDLRPFVDQAHAAGVLVAVATDLLALALATSPGEMGADVAFGNSQRFGVPMGFGGPHAALFATRQEYVRHMPGRVIGVSVDAHGKRAYRMALQTREQHIRREKATSNICTAQALLANMAAMYAVYHGPEGLKAIASRVHTFARSLEGALASLGYQQSNLHYFDTLRVRTDVASARVIRASATAYGLNFRYVGDTEIGIALDETVTTTDLVSILDVFATASGAKRSSLSLDVQSAQRPSWPAALQRKSGYLTHPIFNTHRSETEMMRYIRSLERKDVGLDTSMIPLGSCTMKLNAATEMYPVSWEEFSRMHPFAPADQTEGYRQICAELEEALCAITGFSAVSLQPNSGAQGEFTGLAVLRAYHQSRGERARDVVLIPASAHGTNPASAVMAGFKVVVVATDTNGNVDVADLGKKAAAHAGDLAGLMITYPSTHGVFEDSIRDICATIHQYGGQVYMDGANMNAQVGLTSPATIGADVCHLNLHKTFAIPHGGGGPGMGPIGVAKHLAPFLPAHRFVGGDAAGGDKPLGLSIPPVSSAPFGSASILLISYAYIRMLGAQGVTDATRYAILNANYIKSRLEKHYNVLYSRANGRVAHEMIFDLRAFKAKGVEEGDVAKRLMDYGFHAPTVSFPVPGTLMIEPTESEPKAELDRFCDALIAIRQEIEEVVTGQADARDNVLKHAPHTAAAVSADSWPHAYSREKAAYPLPWVRANKFWPSVARIDNPYGDRNLMCVCPPIEAYG
ncbi:MAG: glycine dehydrogenase (aminomethyl-transferring) [Acidobacteria bacterium RIFCSPLOWO2_12_FULL_67_14b]|nr:MAG: glycine dehydrogenase (aminomethyl-transferring) [Acidobacteria bacterium RIFCSPLOWO2_12_FULL_67_14b]